MFLLFQVTLLCSLSLFHPVCSLSNNYTDKISLVKFRNSIANDNPDGVLSSWNESVHFCKWPGITCSNRHHQRVTVLNLELHKLHGTISPSIGNLSFLRFINLGNNSFSGEIPQQLGRLFRLQHLKLDNNMLEGILPVNLSHCTQLRILNLGQNKLSGTIPSELGSLPRLAFLNLRVNRFTGSIPPSLGNISLLTRFSVAYNSLVGTIPSELSRLIITIAVNRFHGTLPTNIGHTLPNLQVFYMGGNSFSGIIPESFSNASNLQQLDLYGNMFVGQVPTSFGKLSNLIELLLGNNSLGNHSAHSLDFIDSLTNCTQLRVLDLTMNNFGGVLPNSVANLSTQLTNLHVQVNQISGSIPNTLENLLNLIFLSLNDNLFTGLIPPSLASLQNLQIMSLASNGLSGEIPSSIGNLTRIFKLYLNSNKLEGSIPRSIAKCQSLQYLDVSNNALSGAIPEEVFYPPSFLILDMSRNLFTSSLPSRVGNLMRIYNLNLSENKLNGVIPEAIKGCENLEYLFLQGNSFQGSLPRALASLRGLQYLDLSRNNLTGEIPVEFKSFRGMSYLNLSFNNLDGEVPNAGVFKNMSVVSLAGNPKLCGGVPELQLQRCPAKESSQGMSRGLKLTIGLVSGLAGSLLILAFVTIFWRRRSTESKLSSTETHMSFLSKVSYKVLYEATNGFSPDLLVGTGSFGSVYKGTLEREREEQVVAVKVLNLRKRGSSKSFVAECNAMRNIRHRNLVKVLTCCSSLDHSGNEFKALVFEYMPNGSLEKWLLPSRGLNLLQRLNIAIDVASAIHYLHEGCDRPIIHRDVKPSNVLLDDGMVAHLSDFGLARLISNPIDVSESQTNTSGIKGTIGYVAPEYGMGGEPSKQGDMYSFGILILEMFTGRRPTDEMFKEDYNLHSIVKTALPKELGQIVDSDILSREVEETEAKESSNDSDIGDAEIDDTETIINVNRANDRSLKCLASVLEIGLSCSEKSSNQRMNIGDVTKALQHCRDAHLGFEIVG